jgi:hypothetical protein
MEIYKSKFTVIEYFEEHGLLEINALAGSKYLKDNEYKQECFVSLDILKRIRPRRLINDFTDFHFTISPDLQEWVNQFILAPVVDLGIEKIAYVVSNDIFVQLSVVQGMEEAEGSKFAIHYFDTAEQAKAWILS